MIFKRRIPQFFILLGFMLSMAMFFSCTKEIQIEYPKTEKQLVVEGYIEQGKYPIVFLTKSSPYFEKIDSANIAELIASFAKVTVSCDGIEDVLTLRYNSDYFPAYYYEGTSILGEIGKSYTLKIELSGKTYTSTTKIVNPVPIDAFSIIKLKDNDIQKFIDIHFKDPAFNPNFYRVYVKRIGKDSTFYPSYLSTFSDFGFDGKPFTYEVVPSFSPIISTDKDNYFVDGDSVVLKFCTMEESQYNYWKKIEGQIALASNPFGISSSEPPSTITGGALGIWAGLSSKYYTIKIK
jgi:hypothetical protein